MAARGTNDLLMSVTVRKLQPSEWDLLPHEEGELLPDSERSIAIVALDEDGDSHARIFLVSPVHLEDFY